MTRALSSIVISTGVCWPGLSSSQSAKTFNRSRADVLEVFPLLNEQFWNRHR
jgi:hypothetical protein